MYVVDLVAVDFPRPTIKYEYFWTDHALVPVENVGISSGSFVCFGNIIV